VVIYILSVLVVDDHAILRSGVVTLVSSQRDMKVVRETETGDRAVDAREHLRPDS
jgi:DNA-binding NarL/FixJ family response regulator